MPGAIDILVDLQFQSNSDAVTAEITAGTSKSSNVIKELTAAVEKQGQAQQQAGQKIQMSVAEYRKLDETLKTVKKDSTEYVEVLKKAGVEVERNVKQHTSLRTQLRNVREELSRMEQAGEAGTKKFKEMSIAAGQLQDQMGDTQQQIRVLASDTKYLDAGVQAIQGLAGAFAAAQGAAALFGDENEDLQRVMAKVMGALALLNGVQAVANTLNKDSALMVLLKAKAMGASAAATTAEATATTGATVATKGFTAAIAANPLGALVVVLLTAVTALAAFSSGEEDAEDAVERTNIALEIQNDLLNSEVRSLGFQTRLNIAKAKAEGKSAGEILKIKKDSIEEELALENERRQILLDRIKGGEYTKELGDALNAANVRVKELQVQSDETRLNAIAEGNEKRKKENEAAAEKQKQLSEKQAAQLLKLTQELEAAKVEAIEIARNKEIEAARLSTKNKITALENETALTQEAVEKRNQLILQLQENLQVELRKISEKYASENRIALIATVTADPKGTPENPTIPESTKKGLEAAGREEARIKADAREREAKRRAAIDSVNDTNDIIQSTGAAALAFISAERLKTDSLISEQQRRVDAAKESAERGNTIVLKAEEQRLSQLEKRRREYAEKQKAINSALVISQQAVNVVNAIGAVIQSADKSNIITLIATLAAATGAVFAAVSSVKDAEFYEGGYTGNKGEKEVAGVVHGGEYVMPKKIVDKYGKKAMEDIHYGRIPPDTIHAMSVNYSGMLKTAGEVGAYKHQADRELASLLKENNKKQDAIIEYLQSSGGTSITLGEDYFVALLNKDRKNKIKIEGLR